jgi:hypothetical protein
LLHGFVKIYFVHFKVWLSELWQAARLRPASSP